MYVLAFFFFFSSRRRHTRCLSDWSSDVCSSDLWAIEAGTPNVLFRRGFTKDALKPGTAIVIDGYRAKDGSHRANGRNLTLPGGQTLFLGSSATGAPEEKR